MSWAAAFADPYYQTVIAPDEASFVDLCGGVRVVKGVGKGVVGTRKGRGRGVRRWMRRGRE